MDILKTQQKLGTLKIQTPKNLRDLPFDIIVNIISRLSPKLIIRCKSLSKPINKSISQLSFSQLYLTNTKRSPSLSYALFYHLLNPHLLLHLFQFDPEVINSNGLVTDVLAPAARYMVYDYHTVWGYCNGLLCVLKFKCDLFSLFVMNPVLGQSIQLPEPCPRSCRTFFAYGLGFCEVSNRIITKLVGDSGDYVNNGEIFTIGFDEKWRSLDKIPYNMKGGWDPNPQSPMVAFRSALHWVVKPAHLTSWRVQPEPNWGSGICMCMFDMTEEKASAIAMPPGIDDSHVMLSVFSDKIWVWEDNSHRDVSLWVMEDYGVKWSWTKQFVFKLSMLSCNVSLSTLIPLNITPEGVLVLSDSYQVLFIDMKKDKCLRVVQEFGGSTYPIPFVPSFVSLRNL